MTNHNAWLVLVSGLFAGTAAMGAAISWDAVQGYSSTSDISTEGTLVEAVNACGSGDMDDPLINGVQFTASTDVMEEDAATTFLYGDTGDSEYNAMLNSLDYGSEEFDAGSGLLESGTEYLIQIWYVDERSTYGDRTMSYGDGEGNFCDEFEDGFVTGTFVANSTSQTITVEGEHISGYQVRALDTPVPTLSITEGDTVSNMFSVAVDFTKEITGLTEGDFVVSNGVLSDLSGSGSNWSVNVSPTINGDVTVALPEDTVVDADGNDNPAGNTILTTYVAPGSDQPVPTLSTTDAVVYGDFTVQVDFSEEIAGLDTADFEVSGGTVSSVSGSGASWSAVISPNFGGDVTVSLPRNSVTDTDGDGLMNPTCDDLTVAYYVIVDVDSPAELLPYLEQDNVTATLAPGTYTIDAADVENTFGTPRFEFNGSNSTYDFTDVTINFAADVYTSGLTMNHIQIFGNDIVLKNLTMVDLCDEQGTSVEGGTNIIMDGQRNRVEGFHMTVKGSYPYAYGDAFGKGATYVIKHWKHCALLVRGTDNHVKGCTIIHRAYGHAIFMQAAWNPLIEDCYVEGKMRSTDEMLAEEGTGSAADDVDFMTIWGYTLPAGYMMSLGEEGVRSYNDGTTYIDGVGVARNTTDPTVLNCTVKFMRTCVNLGHGSGTKTSIGNTSIGCENFGGGDIMIDDTTDVSYGAARQIGDDADVDVTITELLDTYNGQGKITMVAGDNNNVTVRCAQTDVDQSLQLVVGGAVNTVRDLEDQTPSAACDNVISNLTDYPVYLSTNSTNNIVVSYGPVTDLGVGNNVTILEGFRDENLALNGAATQSSTDWGGDPERAVDGNTSGDWDDDSVTHTESEEQPWWQVDLGDSFDIETIEIWGRTDTAQDRLSNYDVYVYDENSELVWSDYQEDYPDPYVSLDVGGISGRYVKVQLRGDTEPLSLAEVRVSGCRSDLVPYLVGEWTFDNQTLVNSGTSGMTHDGTFMNSTGDSLYSTDTRSGSGYSLKLDSIADGYSNTPGGEFLKINNSDCDDSGYVSTFASHAFTVSMWVKTDGSWSKWDEFAGKGSGDNGLGWGIRARLFDTHELDGLRFSSYADGSNAQDTSPYDVDLLDQAWHLMTATYDGSTMNLYLDANLVASAEDAVITASEAYPLVFGARDDGSRGEDILVDDIQFYNTALSAEEVAALFAGEDAVFSSRFSPVITSTESSLDVEFNGTFGQHYQVEYLDDLSSGSSWQTLTDIVWMTTSPAEVSMPMTNSAGFYRVRWIAE